MELIFLNDSSSNVKLDNIKSDIVVTIGQFDGLHLGHLELLKRTLTIGKEKKLKTAVLTFEPHPDFVLGKEVNKKLITPLNVKKRMIEDLSFDYLFVIDFSLNVANLTPKEFIQKYLINYHVKEVVVGFDFVFGYKGCGKAKDITTLSDNQITTTIIPEVKYNNEKIGSLKVKELLAEGKVDEVRYYLGRYYTISGTVIDGNKIGRKMNIPTANIEVNEDFIQVKYGVYATIVKYHQQNYIGIVNIGYNPSFNHQEKCRLEVHILNFNQSIYGEKLEVMFVKYLRSEMTFNSVAEFIDQINFDKAEAIRLVEPLL